MATLTFSSALADAQRRQQLTGRAPRTDQYMDQSTTARKTRLGAIPPAKTQTQTLPKIEMPDYAEMMEKYTSNMDEMWKKLIASLETPKPVYKEFEPENPTQNLSPPGYYPTMGTPGKYQESIWPGSYPYDYFKNTYYNPTYADTNYFNADPGRTVFDPSVQGYVPMTSALQWSKEGGYQQWDDASKSFKPLPSQIFGANPPPLPPSITSKITNPYEQPTHADIDYYNADPERTVFDPRTHSYVPVTGALQWTRKGGYSQWDDKSKSFVPLPSQVFGAFPPPPPPPPEVNVYQGGPPDLPYFS